MRLCFYLFRPPPPTSRTIEPKTESDALRRIFWTLFFSFRSKVGMSDDTERTVRYIREHVFSFTGGPADGLGIPSPTKQTAPRPVVLSSVRPLPSGAFGIRHFTRPPLLAVRRFPSDRFVEHHTDTNTDAISPPAHHRKPVRLLNTFGSVTRFFLMCTLFERIFFFTTLFGFIKYFALGVPR